MQLLSGLFGGNKKGTPGERMAAEIKRIQTGRQGRITDGVYIVFDGSGEIDPPEFKARKDADDFAVTLGDVLKGALR